MSQPQRTVAGAKAAARDPATDSQTAILSQTPADAGHFSLIKAMHLADVITELNGACGVLSVFSSMRYAAATAASAAVAAAVNADPAASAAGAVAAAAADKGTIYTALAMIPLGFFFDALDGKVARSRKTSSAMGQELDSLADLISFGLSPAAAAYSLGFRTPLDTAILIFFVLCGLTRLARYNVSTDLVPKDATGKAKYFEGTPIPTTMAIAGLMAYWVSQGWTGAALPLGTWGSGLTEFHPVLGLFVAWGCMMTSKSLRVPKP